MNRTERVFAVATSIPIRIASGLVPLSLLIASACSEVEEDAPPTKSEVSQGAAIDGDFQYLNRRTLATTVTGDFNGDEITDILNYFTYSNTGGWGGVPSSEVTTAFSDGTGHISVNRSFNILPSGIFTVGDFDGDGKDEFALFHKYGGNPNVVVPVVTKSDGLGNYVPQNAPGRTGPNFPQYFLDWMNWPTGRVRALACDIDGDDDDDIVLTGPPNWDTMPIAFSNRDGSFIVTNHPIGSFADWTEDQNAKLACDDFNGDGRDDLIVIGGAGWYTVPVAFSNPSEKGTFTVTNIADTIWSTWAAQARTQLVTGDFDGDDKADIMLLGGNGWESLRIGHSTGNGTFGVAFSSPVGLPLWSQTPYARARGGDFDGDHLADVALLGGDTYWDSLPIGTSNGDNTFDTINETIPAPPYPLAPTP